MKYCSGLLFRIVDETAKAKIYALRMGYVGMLVDKKWSGRKDRDRALCPYTLVITAFAIRGRYSI